MWNQRGVVFAGSMLWLVCATSLAWWLLPTLGEQLFESLLSVLGPLAVLAGP